MKDGIVKERYRDYYQEAKNNIEEQSKLIKDIILGIDDYRECVANMEYNCVIYCDPPYANTKEYNNAKGFNYDEFWDLMRIWSKNNIVLISEEHVPKDFKCIWEKETSRSIKAGDKSTSVEKLWRYHLDNGSKKED